ncbi:MAG: D-sedoheptulose 7-phosphate isomerase [Bacteroidota bacterium]
MQEIKDIIAQSITIKSKMLENEALLQTLAEATDKMIQALQLGHKILFCGNGGSAADAQHLAAELAGRFYYDRPPLHAEALHVNSSYLTAVANDYGYDETFRRLMLAKGNTGDVLVGLSTSGNSPNVVAAMQTAQKQGILTVGLTGAGGGDLQAYSDYLLAIPTQDTPRIQECHLLLGHILCERIERTLFPPTL